MYITCMTYKLCLYGLRYVLEISLAPQLKPSVEF